MQYFHMVASKSRNTALIHSEIDRQLAVVEGVDNSLDTKLVFVLGALSIAVSLMTTTQALVSFTTWAVILFLASGVIALIGFWGRAYVVGPSAEELVKFMQKEPLNLEGRLMRAKNEAFNKNNVRIKNKAWFLRISLCALLTAIVFLLVGRVLYG